MVAQSLFPPFFKDTLAWKFFLFCRLLQLRTFSGRTLVTPRHNIISSQHHLSTISITLYVQLSIPVYALSMPTTRRDVLSYTAVRNIPPLTLPAPAITEPPPKPPKMAQGEWRNGLFSHICGADNCGMCVSHDSLPGQCPQFVPLTTWLARCMVLRLFPLRQNVRTARQLPQRRDSRPLQRTMLAYVRSRPLPSGLAGDTVQARRCTKQIRH